MTRPVWGTFELLDAQRRKRKLRTTTVGMQGTVKEVRDDDVVLTLDFGGTAYLQRSAIITPPPSSFQSGDRVTTAYGRGQVVEVRLEPTRCDILVALLECTLAGEPGNCAMAYLGPDSVVRRTYDDRTFGEKATDAATFRIRGNEAFKSKDFETALIEYRKVLDVFSSFHRELGKLEKGVVTDNVMKCLSNMAQSYLSSTPPDYKEARNLCTTALEFDSSDETKQREKLLYRRGCASCGLLEWDAAAVDLADPALAENRDARAKLAQVRECARKEKAKQQKLWGAAFKKAATPQLVEEDDDASPASTPSRGVRFGSPGNPGSGRADIRTPVSSSPADGTRKSGAGVTPFPAKQQQATGEEEEEEEEEDGDGGGAADADATLEGEGTEEEGGWLTNPWTYAGAAAVVAVGYVAYRALRR